MAKRTMVDKKLADDFKKGQHKVEAKGKKRLTEIKADSELEGRMTDEQTKKKRPQPGMEPNAKGVSMGGVRGVVSETMARVYAEIWPSMQTHDERGRVMSETSEECYILGLTMLVGNDDDKPRQGLKMREIEMGDDAPYCQECDAA